MSAYVSGYGNVLGIRNVESDSEVLSITIKCYTGEKKKDDEEYAPSHRFNFLLSKNYVNLVDLKVGDIVFFSGFLVRPYLYDKDGLSYILKLGYGTQVRKIYNNSSKSSELDDKEDEGEEPPF